MFSKPFLRKNVLPGFGLTFGFTCFYLTLIVLIPLLALVIKSFEISEEGFYKIITDGRVQAAFKISFGLSFLAACINAIIGLIIAWVVVRYKFPGKRLIDAMVDIPFAMPTAVSGIALAYLYSPHGWLGKHLNAIGIKVAYTPLGILVALIFIGLPFVVRTLEPVLQDMEKEVEEAAVSLGATRWQVFRKVLFPQFAPALLTGTTIAFARALGEYGTVIFIAGNIPYISEIVPLLIVVKLEQYDYQGAMAIALIMLLASFFLLLFINLLQAWRRKFEAQR